MVDFDRLNRETRDWNNGINGITRNINPVDYARSNGTYGSIATLNRKNDETFKAHNGCYPDRLYR